MTAPEVIRHELDKVVPFQPEAKRGKVNGHVSGVSEKKAPAFTDYVISAVDLDAAKFAPVKFVVRDVLPVGLAVLSAPPKIGKTWLDMGLSNDVASGDLFGGCKPVDQGQVLLLDLESNKRRSQARFKKLRQGRTAPEGLYIANEWPRMDLGGLDCIRQWAKAQPDPRLIVIDIWVKFRTPRPANADAYQFDYDCVKQLQELAHELSVAILIVHHNRKAADSDWLNEISGSQGLAGGADTLITIKRDRAAADAVLHVTGRDVEEQELALKFDKDTGRWSIIGDAADYRTTKARNEIHTLLEREGPKSPKEVADELDQPRNTVKSTMRRMRADGSLKSAGGGKYALA